MKKIRMILAVLAISVITCGCSAGEHIALTEEESDAIAQYSAYLLLKYDKNKNFERKLLDVKELEDIYKERKEESQKDDPTPTPSPTPTPTASPEPSGEAEVTPTPVKEEEIPTEAPVQIGGEIGEEIGNLNDLYADRNFTVSYKSFKISKVYSEDEVSSFSAKEGEKLLSVSISIKNNLEKEKAFISAEHPIEYRLYSGNGDVIAPETSFLPNDLNFLNESNKIGAGKSLKAVLLFVIDEKEESFSLKAVSGLNDKTWEIRLN